MSHFSAHVRVIDLYLLRCLSDFGASYVIRKVIELRILTNKLNNFELPREDLSWMPNTINLGLFGLLSLYQYFFSTRILLYWVPKYTDWGIISSSEILQIEGTIFRCLQLFHLISYGFVNAPDKQRISNLTLKKKEIGCNSPLASSFNNCNYCLVLIFQIYSHQNKLQFICNLYGPKLYMKFLMARSLFFYPRYFGLK